MAATRQIIVLSQIRSVISYVMRADVPSGQENAYKNPDAVSPVGNVSDPDLPGMVAGTIVEERASVDLPQNAGETGNQYKTRAQTYLLGQRTAFQARITAAVPLAFYGAYYDGSAWHNSGA